MDRIFHDMMNTHRGTRMHALAADMIRLGVKLPDTEQTLNMYVNDCIGFRMTPEQPLYYSDFAFGTCDAICFRDNVLRIHDLKTGKIKTKVEQLEVYAALFCLEYMFKPFDIEMILSIYQNDEVHEFVADPDVIFRIMDRIVAFSKRLEENRREALG